MTVAQTRAARRRMRHEDANRKVANRKTNEANRSKRVKDRKK